jgi:ABC-type glycerol-3-phosphate transport system substrate-binding protein
MNRNQLSRRDFLRSSALASTGMLLAACSSNDNETTEEVASQAEPTSAPAQPENIVLTYPNHWHVPQDAHYSALDTIMRTFHEENPNIEIDSIDSPDKQNEKILADCAAGDCPDIIHEASISLLDSGYLVDLAPHLDAAWKGTLVPSMLDMTSWEGKVYGLALEYSPIVTNWNGLVLDKAGLDTPPATWDEFMALGEELKGQGLYLGSFNFGFDYHAVSAITFGQPGAVEAMGNEQWDNQYVRFALERMKEIVDNGYHLPNDLELDWRTAIPFWQTNQMSMYMNGAWTIKNEITAEGVDPSVAENVVFTPFVDCGFGRPIELKMTTAIGLGTHLAGQPERLDAALKWLKYWTSLDSAMLFITDAQSPMGVIIPADKMETAEAQVPMLAAFLGAVDQADTVFSHGLPSKIVRQRSWGMFTRASKEALLTGKSVDEALQIFVEDMEST